MKEIINEIIRETRNDLDKMAVSKMTLADRINYEKALVRLRTLSDMLYRCNVSLTNS